MDCDCITCRLRKAVFQDNTSLSTEEMSAGVQTVAEFLGLLLSVFNDAALPAAVDIVAARRAMAMLEMNATNAGLETMPVHGHG
jgi:uncharacterized protein with ATP-grasp and redox domains